MNELAIRATVNGQAHKIIVLPGMTLLELLRDGLNLTGTKEGCGAGDCGACTILLDGRPVNSCLVLAAEADGRSVTTIEGLGGDSLHPVQKAFVRNAAVQCGFCSPGMIMTAVALLAENPDPTESEVKTAIAGNLCRCSGYTKIIEAVLDAACEMRGPGGRASHEE